MNGEIDEKKLREIQEKMRKEGFGIDEKPVEPKSSEDQLEIERRELEDRKREYMERYKEQTNQLTPMHEVGYKIYETKYIKLLWFLIILLTIVVGVLIIRTIYPDKFRDVISFVLNNTMNQSQSLSAICMNNCSPVYDCNVNCTPTFICNTNSS